jgi:hypothetical protein
MKWREKQYDREFDSLKLMNRNICHQCIFYSGPCSACRNMVVKVSRLGRVGIQHARSGNRHSHEVCQSVVVAPYEGEGMSAEQRDLVVLTSQVDFCPPNRKARHGNNFAGARRRASAEHGPQYFGATHLSEMLSRRIQPRVRRMCCS